MGKLNNLSKFHATAYRDMTSAKLASDFVLVTTKVPSLPSLQKQEFVYQFKYNFLYILPHRRT